MKINRRWIRLRLVWLLVPPFLLLARPTPSLLAAGLVLALAGGALRAWAAGLIRKDEKLAVLGPYAYTRNPLYLGTLLVGLGLALAGGRAAFVVAFLVFFPVVYGYNMRVEARLLEEQFGDAYRAYARSVPAFLPRLRPYRPAGERRPGTDQRFTLERYLGNREYQTALGVAAGFVALAVRLLI